MNKTKKENIKFVTYARKSEEDKQRQIQSIPDQTRIMKEVGERESLDVASKVISDEKSGAKPGVRDGFNEMIQGIKAGKYNGILVWQISRLSRNPEENGIIQGMLQRGEIKMIKTPDREYLPDDNALILAMEGGVANQFIIDLKKNTRRGLDTKLSKGWLPNLAPLGYLNDKTKEQGEKDIIVDPERYELVKKMWKMMLTGAYTPPQIMEIANEEWGLRTRKFKTKGGNKLCLSGVYRMFNNPFYCGIIRRGDGREFQGSHKPYMITLDEFDRVQRLLKSKGNNTIRPKTYNFAFTGFIRCAECGCLYTGEQHTKYIKSTGEMKTYIHYHCTRKKKDIKCTQRKSVNEEALVKQVDELLAGFTILPEFRDWALKKLARENDTEIQERTQAYLQLQKTLNSTQSDFDELTRMRYKKMIDDETFNQEKVKLQTDIKNLRNEIKIAEERADNWNERCERAFDFTTNARSLFNEGGWRTRKGILMDLGQNPTMKDGILRLEANSWLEVIKNEYPALEKEYKRLELKDFTSIKEKTEALTSVISQWGG